MFLDRKSFLKSEIIKLANKGLINKEQEKEILNFYHLNASSDFPFLIILAFLFIGFSLLTLVAYNWQEIPDILKTLLLLATLFGTHLGIFYFKNPIFKQGFGVLSGFVLLANIALLSQIYHLGEDTALAFLSVGCVTLVLAFALKSFAVFMAGYLLTNMWFLLNLYEDNSTHSFAFIIMLGLIIQSGIFFNLSSNATRFLAFVNFIFLGLYLSDFQENNLNLAFSWLSLILLGLHFKSYKLYAYFTLALILLFASYDYVAKEIILLKSSIFLPLLLILLALINLYKHSLLSILIIGFLAINLYMNFYPTSEIIFKGFYSFLTFILGIQLIKENYKILGFLVFGLLILIRYIDLLGDYIGASIIFLCFGLGLLLFARRKNA